MFSIETNRGAPASSTSSKQAATRRSLFYSPEDMNKLSGEDWDPNNPACPEKEPLYRTPPKSTSRSLHKQDPPPPVTTVEVVTNKPIPSSGGLGGMSRTKSLFSMGTSLSSSPASYTTSSISKVHQDSSRSGNNTNNSVISMISIDSTCTEMTPHNPLGPQDDWQFSQDIRRFLGDSPEVPNFDDYAGIRRIMEPHLRRARLARERAIAKNALKAAEAKALHHSNGKPTHLLYNASIASSMGVPYTALRQERPFLFDEHTHPLHTILAEALNVPDLSQLHLHDVDPDQLLLPLLERDRRQAFHEAYDSFVTSHCIPLLHSLAIAKNVFNQNSGAGSSGPSAGHVTYRYQAFPTIHVIRPGDDGSTLPPSCDVINNYSIGCLTFHIPLTPCFGTNCLYVESHPGRENWHPLQAKSVGLGYLFDGSRCLHFGLDNTTDATRVSLTFRVIIYREPILAAPSQRKNSKPTEQNEFSSTPDDSDLCPLVLLEDGFSQAGPGFYDEAVIDIQRRRRTSSGDRRQQGLGLMDVVVKKHETALFDPDYRTGDPF